MGRLSRFVSCTKFIYYSTEFHIQSDARSQPPTIQIKEVTHTVKFRVLLLRNLNNPSISQSICSSIYHPIHPSSIYLSTIHILGCLYMVFTISEGNIQQVSIMMMMINLWNKVLSIYSFKRWVLSEVFNYSSIPMWCVRMICFAW